MKIGLAVGALGAGVTTLSLIGTGVTASFTDAVSSHNTVTAGTFKLTAVADASSCKIGSTIAAITSFTPTTPVGINQSVTAGTIQNTGNNGNTATHTVSSDVTNTDTGRIYTCEFTVFDTGSLPGRITSVTYTPPAQTGSNAYLLNGMKVGIQAVPANGAPPGWYTVSKNDLVSAAAGATFTAPFGMFLQPNPSEIKNLGNSNEGNFGFRVVMTVPASLTNKAQGETVTGMTFTLTGTNI
jgi:predicted ribosomally synthesized peptide with SipW-like signal peptide